MIIFILQPFRSHFYPAFGIANNHRRLGERVVFTTTPPLNETVINEGFEYCEFHYQAEYMVKNFKTFVGLYLKSIVSDEFFNQRKKEFENAFYHVDKLIKKYSPTHVYIDQSLAEYYFFFKPYCKNICILHTKFYSGKVNGIPPLNSLFIPKNNRYSIIFSEFLWFKIFLKQGFSRLVKKVVFLGKDEIYLWKTFCSDYGMDWESEIELKHILNRGIKQAENIILAPKDLEFSMFKFIENIQFYEKPYLKNESHFYSRKYVKFKKKLVNKTNTIIYMSFGTLAFGNSKIEKFYNDILSIAAHFKDTVLIISTSNISMELNSTKNSWIFDFVPQLDVLSFADLFITHGGLGSVKEAFYAQVPMLVVPFNKKTDMMGNAARVKAKGLGDYIDLNNYSKKDVNEKIRLLLRKIKDSQTLTEANNGMTGA